MMFYKNLLHKTILIIFLGLIFFSNGFSNNQKGKEETPKDSAGVWIPKAVLSAGLNQIYFDNWTQGGASSIAWTFSSKLELDYHQKKWDFKNKLDFGYGRTKLGDAGYQTNSNEIFYESVATLLLGWATNPFFSNSIRTAVAAGYNYKIKPPQEIANFFDPGYITQAIGFSYGKIQWIRTRLGLSIQEIFTNVYRQYTNEPATPNKNEAFKLVTGLESVTSNKLQIAKNLCYTSELRLFTRFERLDVWDIRWQNVISAKVNSFIDVNLNFLLVYQRDRSTRAQFQEGLQLGFVYTVL